MILVARKIITVVIVSFLTSFFTICAEQIVPQVLKHENVRSFSDTSKNDLLFSLDKAMYSAENVQDDVNMKSFLSEVSKDFILLKPLLEESLQKRSITKEQSLLLSFLENKTQRSLVVDGKESMFNAIMSDPAKKSQFFRELRSLVKDIRISMDLGALTKFEQWKRAQIVGSPVQIGKSHMEWLNAQMIPQGFDQLVRLVHKASVVQGILLRYMAMIERKDKIAESDILDKVSSEATEKFFTRCEKIFLVELRESLEMICLIKHTISPAIEYSFKQHNISFEDSFFHLLFSQNGQDAINVFKEHVKTLNDFDKVCMEFLAFGQDLIKSFSPRVVQQYQAWKKSQ